MTTYIVLLRGINVNGQKMIKMTELLALCEQLHFLKVKTYIQSGNVVFQSPNPHQQELENQLAEKIRAQFGYVVPVLINEAAEWRYILENNPFITEPAPDILQLHVTFLAREPASAFVAHATAAKYAPDEYRVAGNVIYLRCLNGYGNTKLSNNFFEHQLKVTATTRNWKTVQALMTIADDITAGAATPK